MRTTFFTAFAAGHISGLHLTCAASIVGADQSKRPGNGPLDYIGGGFDIGGVVEVLRKGAEAFATAKRNYAEFEREIEAARKAFWAQYPYGPRRAQAEAEFARKLREKDIQYFILFRVDGRCVGGARPEHPNMMSAMMHAAGGEVDGGLAGGTARDFCAWLEAADTPPAVRPATTAPPATTPPPEPIETPAATQAKNNTDVTTKSNAILADLKKKAEAQQAQAASAPQAASQAAAQPAGAQGQSAGALAGPAWQPCGGDVKSGASQTVVPVEFVNASQQPRELIWFDFAGAKVVAGTLQPGQRAPMQTYTTHAWMIAHSSDQCMGTLVISKAGRSRSVKESADSGSRAERGRDKPRLPWWVNPIDLPFGPC